MYWTSLCVCLLGFVLVWIMVSLQNICLSSEIVNVNVTFFGTMVIADETKLKILRHITLGYPEAFKSSDKYHNKRKKRQVEVIHMRWRETGSGERWDWRGHSGKSWLAQHRSFCSTYTFIVHFGDLYGNPMHLIQTPFTNSLSTHV